MSRQWRRWLTTLAAVGCLASATAGAVGAAGGPDFFSRGASGFRGAAQRSLASGKPLFLYFYTDWCGYCRQFERELLSSAEVVRVLREQFEPVAINPEAGDEEAALGNSYGLRSFPLLLVQSPGPQGPTPLRRWVVDGGTQRLMLPAEFVQALEAAAAAARPAATSR
jgi:thiol-disulfide isomerase/thioredoxin